MLLYLCVKVETTTGVPMSQESADALHLGVGVAATCIGVVCSLYTCCCHVWRRLKGHTPAVAAGAAVAAGSVAVGQLASGLSSGQPGRADPVGRAEAQCPRAPDDRCAGENPAATCQSHVVSCLFIYYNNVSLFFRFFGRLGHILNFFCFQVWY